MANFVPQIPASTPAQRLALAVGGHRRASDRRIRGCALVSGPTGQARTPCGRLQRSGVACRTGMQA